MTSAQVKTITSREFSRDVSAAKRMAAGSGAVIITDRGEPSFALLPIAEYRRLTVAGKNPVKLLRMPEAGGYDFDVEQIRMEAKELDM